VKQRVHSPLTSRDSPERSGQSAARDQLLREEENPAVSSNRARNDAFGYLVAGRLLAAGVPVVAVDGYPYSRCDLRIRSDVTFQWHGTLIDIECKRPQSYAALEARTKEAREQIQRPKPWWAPRRYRD